MRSEQETLPIGTIIQNHQEYLYIIEALLGRGGFSTIYLVREVQGQQRFFALKEIIGPDRQTREQLVFEADLLERLHHRSLLHIYQIFENSERNRIYMLMDYIEGKNLESLRRKQPEQRFSLALSLALITPIVDTITYLHAQKPPIIHRDIKPSNIIVPPGIGNTVLVDFGLAKAHNKQKTRQRARYGTPGYAAPEQYTSGTDERTDIYAIAATLYTLITGQIPTDALKRNLLTHDADPLIPAHHFSLAISPALSQVIARAMHLRIEERYTSIEAFWEALSMTIIQPPDNQPRTATLYSVPRH
ncbi:MAG TPA: serine/threonine-protein kinase [Dictyobacter sp.]|nr:serine/threonine-protein kinase [Dictyobacter sp.]